ncbi:MAG: hypothetical protein AB7O44_32075 [Hyphomicrobiaceae bacterium]
MPNEIAGEDGWVSREAVLWAFRFFIGREATEEEIAFHRQHANLESLRMAFALTAEFDEYHRGLTGGQPCCASVDSALAARSQAASMPRRSYSCRQKRDLFRLYHDQKWKYGEWWSTPRELSLIADY